MKLLLSTLLVTFALSSAAYYEDHPEVITLADSGSYSLNANSSECPRRYWPKNENVELKGKEGSLCVEELNLPQDVAFDVMEMKSSELENESDYDQRVTSVLSFRSSLFKGVRFSLEGLTRFAKAMNIPESHLKDLNVESEKVKRSTFSMFDNLFIGLEFVDQNNLQKWLYKELKGELVQIVTFGEGVELYPGGGFYVTHYLVIANDQAIYLKLSWWNS